MADANDLDHCYRILELEPTATPDEIKRAWRDLAKVWHPDRFKGDPHLARRAEEKLKAINDAYRRLSEAQQSRPRLAQHSEPGPPGAGQAEAPQARPAGPSLIVLGVTVAIVGVVVMVWAGRSGPGPRPVPAATATPRPEPAVDLSKLEWEYRVEQDYFGKQRLIARIHNQTSCDLNKVTVLFVDTSGTAKQYSLYCGLILPNSLGDCQAEILRPPSYRQTPQLIAAESDCIVERARRILGESARPAPALK
jgi:hypothetical protein